MPRLATFPRADRRDGSNPTANRDGLQIYSARFGGALVPAFENFELFGEFGIQRNNETNRRVRANAWYLNRENDLGSIEVGKLADLVVLDRDYFSVSDTDMRRTRPVLTVVDGEIVYDAGVLRGDRDEGVGA